MCFLFKKKYGLSIEKISAEDTMELTYLLVEWQ